MTHPVIMLARNALELTKQAVASVLAQDIDVHLTIVDNCSSDGTYEHFQALDPNRIYVQRFCPPLGVSASWNWALIEAFRTSDHVLVLNNDLQLLPQTYRVLLADGGSFVTAVSVGDPKQLEWDGEIRKRPNPDFSCYVIRKSAWDVVGMFDESMVLYVSDCDYHLRMHQAGIEAYTTGVPFYHFASGTLKLASEAERTQIHIQANQDRETFRKKWGVSAGSDEYYKMFNGSRPEMK